MMTESNMATMIATPNGNIDNRTEYEFVEPTVSFRDPVPSNITCFAGGEEMLRVSPDGFWVRGVKVEQDAQEAQAVYNAFKQWMAWTSLEGQY
jgi:hypothetical protein